ncbi:hypothetical protein APR42_12845 [Salegentibacter mishustinae]|uniref:Uncharacterized protein n=1 Tax=Salegentibacter mishustinae TaxID=270918 RepID=A0A0Q9ZAY9_9FLAO|nr:hypothetical protein APR42_12845 [Salegentibacter mishustinae]
MRFKNSVKLFFLFRNSVIPRPAPIKAPLINPYASGRIVKCKTKPLINRIIPISLNRSIFIIFDF